MSLTEFFLQPVWQRVAFTLVHFLWQVKGSKGGHPEPLVYAAILAVLLALRAWHAWGPRRVGPSAT